MAEASNSWTSYPTDCRHFNGYKPCGRSATCSKQCATYDPVQTRILLVHLGAMGAVVRSTSLLKSIKRKFPKSHITWVTESPMQNLLVGNPLLDRVLLNNMEGRTILQALSFDVAFVVDKSLAAAGIVQSVKIDHIFGFISEPRTGAIVPATPAATELWELGLNDHQKFFVNQKPETQLISEALELPYQRDKYFLHLTSEEETDIKSRRHTWAPNGEVIVGINTGCGPLMPAKKLSVAAQREIVQKLSGEINIKVVLLGGPEDTLRNQAIGAGLNVQQTATNLGLRDGLSSIAACDVIITGDSLGMHLAIAMNKFVVAWFGPSCAQEIDLYDRGAKVLTNADCSPCWKRSCQKSLMCYDQVNIDEIISHAKTAADDLQIKEPRIVSNEQKSTEGERRRPDSILG